MKTNKLFDNGHLVDIFLAPACHFYQLFVPIHCMLWDSSGE